MFLSRSRTSPPPPPLCSSLPCSVHAEGRDARCQLLRGWDGFIYTKREGELIKQRQDLILYAAKTVTWRWGILCVRGGCAPVCIYVWSWTQEKSRSAGKWMARGRGGNLKRSFKRFMYILFLIEMCLHHREGADAFLNFPRWGGAGLEGQIRFCGKTGLYQGGGSPGASPCSRSAATRGWGPDPLHTPAWVLRASLPASPNLHRVLAWGTHSGDNLWHLLNVQFWLTNTFLVEPLQRHNCCPDWEPSRSTKGSGFLPRLGSMGWEHILLPLLPQKSHRGGNAGVNIPL